MFLRKLCLILILLAGSFSTYAQIYIVKEPTTCLYGLKGKDSKWILKPTYTLIQEMRGRSGKYKVLLNNKTGIIGSRGQIIIPLLYDEIDYVSAGYSYDPDSVRRKQYTSEAEQLNSYYLVKENNLWGIIDSAGREILPVAYSKINSFHNAVAVVRSADGKTGFAGCKGLISYLPDRYRIQYISYNQWEQAPRRYRIAETQNKKIRYGICNEKSELILPCEYESITEDGNGIQTICAWQNGLAGFYSTDGKQLTEHVYGIPNESKRYSSGNGLMVTQNGKRGIIDRNAVIRIPCVYDSLKLSYAGQAAEMYFGYKDKRWGVYNGKNELILPYYFEMITQEMIAYSQSPEWFYCVRSNGKWGAIDQTGKELMEIRYDTVIHLYRDLLFWSPEDAAVFKYSHQYGFLYLSAYKPEKEKNYPMAFPTDGNYALYYYDYENDSSNICRLSEKSDWNYSEDADSEAKKKEADEYRYAKVLGIQSGYTVYHLSQISSADSSWFLASYRPAYDWSDEFWFEGYQPQYPVCHPLIHKTKNSPINLFPYPAYSADAKSDYIIYQNEYQEKKEIVLLKKNLSFVNDTISCDGISFCCYADHEPLFTANRSSNYGQSVQLINKEGENQLPAGYNFISMINADTAWVALQHHDYNPCFNNYNLFRISSRELLLEPNQMLMVTPDMSNGISIAGTTRGYDFFDNRQMRFTSSGHYRMIMPFPAGKKDEYFTVLTPSGKTIITNNSGKLLTDSMRMKIVCPLFFDWNENGFRAESLPLVIVRENAFYHFEKNKLTALDAADQKRIIDNTCSDLSSRTSDYYGGLDKRVHKFRRMEFRTWQYSLLMDSLFQSPLFSDYRMAFNEDHFTSNYYESQRYARCPNWKELPPDFFRVSNRYVLETTLAGDGAFSYQRSGYSIESNPRLRDRIYYNYLLYADSAVCIPLDSLFEGYAWKDFITQLLTDSLEANPNYESPCINANAYPFLLRYRFLMTNERLYLYPEWHDKRRNYWRDEFEEFEIEIPWEKLKPYLKPGIAEKIGLK